MLLGFTGSLAYPDRWQTAGQSSFQPCTVGPSLQLHHPAQQAICKRLQSAQQQQKAVTACRAGSQEGRAGNEGADGDPTELFLKDSQSWRSFRAQLVALEQRQLQSISAERPRTHDAQQDASHWVHQIACPEVGSLLIARHPDLGIFTRTVILIIAHETGPNQETVGLILNLPTRLLIEDEKADTDEPGKHAAHKLWMGGPCSPHLLFALHSCAELGDPQPIIEGIFQIEDTASTIAAMNKGLLPPEKVRFFSGYSGWGPGQLTWEVEVGSWWVAAASSTLVQECLSGVGWREDGSNESDGMWHRFRRLLDVQEPDSPAPGMGDFQP